MTIERYKDLKQPDQSETEPDTIVTEPNLSPFNKKRENWLEVNELNNRDNRDLINLSQGVVIFTTFSYLFIMAIISAYSLDAISKFIHQSNLLVLLMFSAFGIITGFIIIPELVFRFTDTSIFKSFCAYLLYRNRTNSSAIK